jgi:hypothetical protein
MSHSRPQDVFSIGTILVTQGSGFACGVSGWTGDYSSSPSGNTINAANYSNAMLINTDRTTNLVSCMLFLLFRCIFLFYNSIIVD